MATPSLLARVADIWSRDFASLPVHRDLPRLTNQLEIAEGSSHTIVRRQPPSTIHARTLVHVQFELPSARCFIRTLALWLLHYHRDHRDLGLG